MSLSEEPPNTLTELPKSGTGHDVGYKKPPIAHRFKPGQSGNPKGRTKGSMSRRTKIEKYLNKKVHVQVEGKVEIITMDDLIYRNIINKAAKSSVPHIKLLEELKKEIGVNEPIAPLTNIIVTFVDSSPEMQAAQKLEDEQFEELDREKQRMAAEKT